MKPHVFSNLVWNNVDRLEETLIGKGISHQVNGIAVQSRLDGPHPPSVETTTSLQPEAEISHHLSPRAQSVCGCSRVGPQPLLTQETVQN